MTLGGTETAPDLEARLARIAAELLIATLPGWLDGSLPAVPQPAEGATLTRPLRRDDARLDPSLSAVELERRIRAHQPWPGAWIEQPGGRLIVSAAHPGPAAPPDPLTSASSQLAALGAAAHEPVPRQCDDKHE